MSLNRGTIIKNTSILMFSQLVTWLLTFGLTLFLPRYLGVENIGRIHLATSLWVIVTILATFGMDAFLTREIARDHDRLNLLITQSIFVRLVFFLLAAAVLTIYTQIANYEPATVVIILIIGLSSFTMVIAGAFRASIQGLERMEFIAFSAILNSILITSLSFLAIFRGLSVEAIAWIQVIGAIGGFLILVIGLTRMHPLRIVFSAKDLRLLLVSSFSFFLLYVFISLYQEVDVVVISLLLDEKGVGWYSVADRLIGSLMFIPVVFMAVFFPTFSRLYEESPELLKTTFRKTFNLMVLLGVAIGFGLFVVAGPFVRMLYGAEFAPSAQILGIRSLVVVFTFTNILLGMYLMSTNRQKPWIIVLAAAFIMTIVLDIILVPYCQRVFGNGALGGAFAYLITEVGMATAGILLLPPQTLERSNLIYATKCVIAGAGMILGVWWLRDIFILVPILVGIGIFIFFTFVFHLISKEEWDIVKQYFLPILNKFQKLRLRIVN